MNIVECMLYPPSQNECLHLKLGHPCDLLQTVKYGESNAV